MKESYYIYDTANSGKLGPYSISQLKEMYRAGTINAKTFVCLDGSSAWQEVAAIENKFADSTPSSVSPSKKVHPAQGCFGCLGCFLLLFAIGFLAWVILFPETVGPTPAVVATVPQSSASDAPTPAESPAQTQADSAAAQAAAVANEARKKAEEERSKKEAETFIQTLTSIGVDGTIVSSAYVDPNNSLQGDNLTIVVADQWHSQPYQLRLECAQNFFKLWMSIHSPNHANESRITLTDLNGNEVGGSSMWSGVWVKKEE